MADGAVIGALRVVLGADTASFDQGLKQSQAGLAAFGAAVSTGLAAVAAAAVAASVAMGVALTRTIDDMDKLNKTSQKLGIPVEQLSALAYAADLADVSFEALSKGVGKLSKNMVEAAGKPTSEAAGAFRALGVSVTDANGKLKSSDVVLGDLANAFEGLKDGPGKTAVAMALFGKAGADLIPLLNGGRAGLKEMNEEMKAWGAVVSTGAAKQAEVFNDNLTKLGYAVKGLFVQTAEKLLPTLVNMSAGMVEWAKNSGVLDTALNVISNTMKGLVTGGVIVGAVFKTLAEYVSTVSTALGLLLKGEFTKAWDRIQTGVSGVGETAKSSFATVKDLWTGATTGAAAAAIATDEATKKKKEFNYAALAGKNALDQFFASQQKSLAAQQADFDATGMAAGAKERLKTVLQGLAIAQANGIVMTDQQRIKLTETANAAELLALKLGSLALLGAGTNPFEAISIQIDALKAKMDSGSLSTTDFAIVQEQTAKLTQKMWADSATSLAGSFETIGSSLSQMNEGWAKAAKVGQAIGAAVAFVNAYVAASNAFATTMFPANIAIAAGVLAKGVAMVASINSIGFAEGGLVQGPGSGTSDSIPARLSAGEFVMPADRTRSYLPQLQSMHSGDFESDVSTRGFGGGSFAAPSTTVIQVSGFDPKQLYSGDQMRDLIHGINGALRDGHRIEIDPK
ncbi:MAG: hypothetical protein Q8L13_19215 [Bradyrhizobium sp.]|uniref:phage tail tape measure protein n=1 Tax=Bradyrhizobium sp. TaxID=376 RepID=UPI0027303EF1|nr:phage tail tape measure protein [Bradyrhizobium sp.]MDP1868453.1 hypothetical protein [Bradyrhizobium sp.]